MAQSSTWAEATPFWGTSSTEATGNASWANPAPANADAGTNGQGAHNDETNDLAKKFESATLGESNVPDEEKKKEAADHGWAATIPLDYEAIMNKDSSTAEGSLPSWMANTGTYQWKDEYGELGPEDPELEKVIFDEKLLNSAGAYLKQLQNFHVHQEGEVEFAAIKEVG